MPLNVDFDRIRSVVSDAVISGMNTTMSAAVIDAKTTHPWQNRTAILEGSINTYIPAQKVQGGYTGVWGSADVVYAKFLERQRRWRYLMPAADREYPKLVSRIRRALGG